jgi:hypothetical protein
VFFGPTPKYLRKAPCYDFYATSVMKKRNLFPSYQKLFVISDTDGFAKKEEQLASFFARQMRRSSPDEEL